MKVTEKARRFFLLSICIPIFLIFAVSLATAYLKGGVSLIVFISSLGTLAAYSVFTFWQKTMLECYEENQEKIAQLKEKLVTEKRGYLTDCTMIKVEDVAYLLKSYEVRFEKVETIIREICDLENKNSRYRTCYNFWSKIFNRREAQ